jgi:hypothetical protein
MFHWKFEAVAEYSNRAAHEKALHLLAILKQGLPVSHTLSQPEWHVGYHWGTKGILQRPPDGKGQSLTTQSQDPAQQQEFALAAEQLGLSGLFGLP